MQRLTKKAVLLVIIVCLVIGMSQTAAASGTFYVTDGVNVRESATTNSKSLTTVIKDTSVEVLEHNPDGWSKVQIGSIIGYIRSDYLKLRIGDTPAVFRVTDGVHVRENASTSSKSMTTVGQDTNVDVLEHDPAGWSKVKIGSITGYIRSDFLKYTGTSSSAANTNTTQSGSTESVIEQRRLTGDDVNMRKEASPNAGIITTLAKDTIVDVLADESNGWSKVLYNGETGYIRSDFLGQLQTTAGQQQTQTTQTYYTTGNVNFRSEPVENQSTFIKTLVKGTAVEVVENEANGWSKVIYNGTNGYIKTELLTSTAPSAETQTMYTNDVVHLRAKATKDSTSKALLPKGTAVTVYENEANGWSNVKYNGIEGYIKTEYLSSTQSTGQAVGRLRVIAPSGANVRSGPSATTTKIDAITYGTEVDVLSHEANGWSRISYKGETRYISTELLGSAAPVELVTMAEISHLLPTKQNIRVVDVRTGISYNIRIFSKGKHADYETPTREDTDIMFAIRNGVRSWTARPLWVYVGDRVFAASTHSMPHDVSTISNNGLDGHLCLHFKDTVTNNKGYQADLRNAVQEAYDKRP